MDSKFHAYIIFMDPSAIDKMKELVDSSIWTCIGPTSRLNLKNFLTTTHYLLRVKVKCSCLHAFMHKRACLSIIEIPESPQNV